MKEGDNLNDQKGIQWGFIFTGLLFVFLASIFTTVLPLISLKFQQPAVKSEFVTIPGITKEGVENQKGKEIDYLSETSQLKIATIYSEPLFTPSFVTNPDKLKAYLEQNSVEINIEGDLSESFLYVKTSPIDVQLESVYFFIINDHTKQGHLVSSESLVSSSNSEFLYDMSKLPLRQLQLTNFDRVNIIEEFLNKDLMYKTKKRQYFVGGFVSTTKLPNQIEKMEIRYKCKLEISCSVQVGSGI